MTILCFAEPGVICDGRVHSDVGFNGTTTFGSASVQNDDPADGAGNGENSKSGSSSSEANTTADESNTPSNVGAVDLVKCRSHFYHSTDAVFNKTEKCYYVGKQPKSYRTALALSVFLGPLGLDRFYLGRVHRTRGVGMCVMSEERRGDMRWSWGYTGADADEHAVGLMRVSRRPV